MDSNNDKSSGVKANVGLGFSIRSSNIYWTSGKGGRTPLEKVTRDNLDI